MQHSWWFALKVSDNPNQRKKKEEESRKSTEGKENVDVKVEAGVFEKAESTLPFLAPHGSSLGGRRRRQQDVDVLGAHLQPNILMLGQKQ